MMKVKTEGTHLNSKDSLLKRVRPKVDVRATIGFAPEIYEILQDIAFSKRVSIGHIVREAVDSYLIHSQSRLSVNRRNVSK